MKNEIETKGGKKISKKIPEILIEQLEQAISRIMVQNKIPGASIACMVQDEIIYAKGFGARNLEQNLPATPNTLYGFGSNSKSYLALGLLQLIEEGKLKLDDPIDKYLPVKLGK